MRLIDGVMNEEELLDNGSLFGLCGIYLFGSNRDIGLGANRMA